MCIETRDHPHFRFPLHIVHPEHRRPLVWDVRGEAICRYCGAWWRYGRDNRAELLG